ncbi:hypothetical protein KBD61_04430 [Patescibacteria group bacterium]|nr:hypothetical protein [Patescibacteria group bacterium]MBP9710241.1 hypothetical protein [Patescibacteria group bacterium]
MKIKIPVHDALKRLDSLLAEAMVIHTLELNDEEEIQNRRDKWLLKAQKHTSEIFEDTEPSYRLSSLTDRPRPSSKYTKYGAITSGSVLEEPERYYEENYKKKISMVAEMYREVEKMLKVPLRYVFSSSRLYHYDLVCQLKRDSFEESLCRYMFDAHDFGEFVECDVIGEALKEDYVSNEKERTEKIKAAANEINRKTNKTFGFPIFKTVKSQIALTYPQYETL